MVLCGAVSEPAKALLVGDWLLAPPRAGDFDLRDAMPLHSGTETVPGSAVMEPKALVPKGKASDPPGLLHRERAIAPLTSTGLLLLVERLAGEVVARMARSIGSEPPTDVRRLPVGRGGHLGGGAAVTGVEHTAGGTDKGKLAEPAVAATTASACCLPLGDGELA